MRKKFTLVLMVLVLVLAGTTFLVGNKNFSGFDLALALDQVEALADGEDDGEPTCAAGGCHATSCSFNGEISIAGYGGTYSNSISCDDAWACCFTTAKCFEKSRCSW